MILPHYRKRIIARFKNSANWNLKDIKKNRKYFAGKMEINDTYTNKKIPKKWLTSTGNPIRYTKNKPKEKTN